MNLGRYQHPFRVPAGTWQTLRLPWPGFIRTRRGKELDTQLRLDPSNIIRLPNVPPPLAVSYGVMLSSATVSALSTARLVRLKCSCSGCRAWLSCTQALKCW